MPNTNYYNKLWIRAAGSRGFTLVELLVVIAIIGVLVALLLPAIQAAREAGRSLSCKNNLKQLSHAIALYEDNRGSLPAGRMGCDTAMSGGAPWPAKPCGKLTGQGLLCGASGFVSVLPFLEQQALFDTLDPAAGLWVDNLNDLSWYWGASEAKRDALLVRPTVHVCPTSSSLGLTEVYPPTMVATGNYAFSNGTLGPDSDPQAVKYNNDGAFLYAQNIKVRQVTAGLSNTIFLGEVTNADTWESSNVWNYGRIHSDSLRSTRNPLNTMPGEGIIRNRQNGAFGSMHPGGANFAYGDGHVNFIAEDIDSIAYQAQSSITGEASRPAVPSDQPQGSSSR